MINAIEPGTSGRTTPEPGRRTPLGDRWVDIRVDGGHVSTMVDTLLACGFGRGAFQGPMPRPPQRNGRYQMNLDADGDVLRVTLNTLRTGVACSPRSFRNPADYEEYARQLDMLLWNRMYGFDAIDRRLIAWENQVERIDEVNDLVKDFLGLYSQVQFEIRRQFLTRKPGDVCRVEHAREQTEVCRLYLGLLGVHERTLEPPGNRGYIGCKFTLPDADAVLTDEFSALRKKLTRFRRAQEATHRLYSHHYAQSCATQPKEFERNIENLGKSYVRAAPSTDVVWPLEPLSYGNYTDLVVEHMRTFLELIGATNITFVLNLRKRGTCSFRVNAD